MRELQPHDSIAARHTGGGLSGSKQPLTEAAALTPGSFVLCHFEHDIEMPEQPHTLFYSLPGVVLSPTHDAATANAADSAADDSDTADADASAGAVEADAGDTHAAADTDAPHSACDADAGADADAEAGADSDQDAGADPDADCAASMPVGSLGAGASRRKFSVQLLVSDGRDKEEYSNKAAKEPGIFEYDATRAHWDPDKGDWASLDHLRTWHALLSLVVEAGKQHAQRMQRTVHGKVITPDGELRFTFGYGCKDGLRSWGFIKRLYGPALQAHGGDKEKRSVSSNWSAKTVEEWISARPWISESPRPIAQPQRWEDLAAKREREPHGHGGGESGRPSAKQPRAPSPSGTGREAAPGAASSSTARDSVVAAPRAATATTVTCEGHALSEQGGTGFRCGGSGSGSAVAGGSGASVAGGSGAGAASSKDVPAEAMADLSEEVVAVASAKAREAAAQRETDEHEFWRAFGAFRREEEALCATLPTDPVPFWEQLSGLHRKLEELQMRVRRAQQRSSQLAERERLMKCAFHAQKKRAEAEELCREEEGRLRRLMDDTKQDLLTAFFESRDDHPAWRPMWKTLDGQLRKRIGSLWRDVDDAKVHEKGSKRELALFESQQRGKVRVPGRGTS